MVPRGRVELPTPAFSGPRSTGELPRHRNNQRFYGKLLRAQRENEAREAARKRRAAKGHATRRKANKSALSKTIWRPLEPGPMACPGQVFIGPAHGGLKAREGQRESTPRVTSVDAE